MYAGIARAQEIKCIKIPCAKTLHAQKPNTRKDARVQNSRAQNSARAKMYARIIAPARKYKLVETHTRKKIHGECNQECILKTPRNMQRFVGI